MFFVSLPNRLTMRLYQASEDAIHRGTRFFKGMFKNQLQELAQRSCFNLPSYSCVREGADHAPRFKATVNFNGETFESPTFCSTLRQAEHAAAEVALNTLANRGPSRALAAKVLDETGVYKNLLQEAAHRAGLNIPKYTTVRCGPAHVPNFSCTVELAGLRFSGEHAKTKKQAQKNAALAGWSTLKQLAQSGSSSSTSAPSSSESEGNDEEQFIIARFLASLQPTISKSPMHNGHKDRPEKSLSNGRDQNPTASSLYPLQYETWAYPSFNTEMAMYSVWQQAQLSQLQSSLMSLPVPHPVATSHVLPIMPSYFQPDHNCFTARKQEHFPVGSADGVAASRPAFYLSNSMSAPTRGRSMATFQEIQEAKAEGSSSEVFNLPVSSGRKIEKVIQVSIQENDKKSATEGKNGDAGLQDCNPTGHFASLSPKSIDSGFWPLLPYASESPWSNLGPGYPPRARIQKSPDTSLSITAPVRIRTAPVPFGSARPETLANRMPAPPKMKSGLVPCSSRPRIEFGLPPHCMAPAVKIRSVVPVCSAPPAKDMSIPNQEQESSAQERTEQEAMSAVSLELGNLQM